MRETRTTEFKESITNTFLKTVSAFSNYDGGEIFFGIDDNGNIKGLSDVKQACLDIENKTKIRLMTVLLRSPIIRWNCRITTER